MLLTFTDDGLESYTAWASYANFVRYQPTAETQLSRININNIPQTTHDDYSLSLFYVF